ncbi:ABC transporter permease [Arvimicrobium flavum]|uniref:ABC transporter permease n=1 Tax=Arvimicrobium flavum TaxID=3393320 RepID=UPI00237A6439|nr:ABC transporter permease [Mesorhizobium shangrilense]
MSRAPTARDDDSGVAAAMPVARPRKNLANSPVAVALGWATISVLFLGLWEWAGQTKQINVLFFSYPSAIWDQLLKGLATDLLTVDTRTTLLSAFSGFVVAAVAGVLLAFALSQLPYVNKVLRPFFTAFNSLPRIALAPLFIMWFGIGVFSNAVMAGSLTFFVVFANTMAGFEGVDQDHLLLSRLQGATRWQVFRYFVIPSALPSIFVGLELGFIFGMLGAVGGEMIAGERGLGVRLQRDAGVFNTAGYFATLFMLIIISSILMALFQLIKRRMVRWQDAHLIKRA